ncbi:MAG: transposase, partial [Hymenobacteraceae bacterium]|nr:transposase [Hymenobacteraceae bacterium]MDX5395769.1 transposase [Hymenobacteraceae bacterium]MDX5511824.1 transposase [Hymenobacteraceae bacterium]
MKTTRPYTMLNPEGVYFITFSVVFWIDVFIRLRYKNIIVESLNDCIKQKGLVVHGWCLMSSHVHLIISAKDPDKVVLADVLRDLKKFTSGQILREIEAGNESRQSWLLDKFRFAASQNSRNSAYQFWQQNNHAIELTSNFLKEQKLNYIHENPVKDGWVEEP